MMTGDFIKKLCTLASTKINGQSENDFEIYRVTWLLLQEVMQQMGKEKKVNTEGTFLCVDGMSVRVRFGSDEGHFTVNSVINKEGVMEKCYQDSEIFRHPYYSGVYFADFDRYKGKDATGMCWNCEEIIHGNLPEYCPGCGLQLRCL